MDCWKKEQREDGSWVLIPMESTADTNEITSSNPSHVRKWLAKNHPKQFKQLEKFEIELRLGRLSTSSTSCARNTESALSLDPNSAPVLPTNSSGGGSSLIMDGCSSSIGGQDRRLVTKRTVELLRNLIGNTRWKTPAQLLMLLRGLGRELYSAGGFREPAIGNVVRRVMCAVRDEVVAMESSASALGPASSLSTKKPDKKHATRKSGESDEIDDQVGDMVKDFNSATRLQESTRLGSSSSRLSLSTMLWSHTAQHVKSSNTRNMRKLRSDSFASVNSDRDQSNNYYTSKVRRSDEDLTNSSFSTEYHVVRPDFKEHVMETIQEVVSELEDLHKNINDQALNHIHAGEIILTYGRSKTIEYVSYCLSIFKIQCLYLLH